MGGCFSSWARVSGSDDDEKPSPSTTANVITINGEFRQFATPITISQALLQIESASSSFICNSDNLYYDELIPALDSDHELQSGQIYFILPKSKLHYPLSASEMAALAVKASVALSENKRRSNNNRKKRWMSPVISMEVDEGLVPVNKSSMKSRAYSDKQAGLGLSRSGSMKKLQRYSSRRAKLAVRSFRLRLNTIYEGSVLQFY